MEYGREMYDETRSNIFKQGTKILYAIADHYDSGGIESPEANDVLMLLFGLIAEKKVSGLICEDSGQVKWQLSPQYEKELKDARKGAYKGENIVSGPWS